MARCYGCSQHEVRWAGEFCPVCKPAKTGELPPHLRYMPTPENERSAITAFLHVLRVRAVEKERNTDYRQALYDAEIAIKQGEHTK